MNHNTPERAKENRKYDRLVAVYKEQNTRCVYCDRELPLDDRTCDHIVSGTGGKAASLLYFDTWNIACLECNTAHYDLATKVACKLLNVLQTIERLRGRNLSDEEELRVIRAIVNRESGHVRT